MRRGKRSEPDFLIKIKERDYDVEGWTTVGRVRMKDNGTGTIVLNRAVLIDARDFRGPNSEMIIILAENDHGAHNNYGADVDYDMMIDDSLDDTPTRRRASKKPASRSRTR